MISLTPVVEAIVALVGLALCAFVAFIAHEEATSETQHYLVIVPAMSAALYFLVRFIHWAWLTPIPFTGR